MLAEDGKEERKLSITKDRLMPFSFKISQDSELMVGGH